MPDHTLYDGPHGNCQANFKHIHTDKGIVQHYGSPDSKNPSGERDALSGHRVSDGPDALSGHRVPR